MQSVKDFRDSSMSKPAIQTISSQQERVFEAARQVAVLVGASLFVALCARITIPLPFTPVSYTHLDVYKRQA